MSTFKYNIGDTVIVDGHYRVITNRYMLNGKACYSMKFGDQQFSGWGDDDIKPVPEFFSPVNIRHNAADHVTDDIEDENKKDPSQANPIETLKAENHKLRTLLNTAAGLLFRLEEYKCINTDDEDFEPQLDHWRMIGRETVREARALLNFGDDLL